MEGDSCVVGRDDELASLSAGLDDLHDGRGGCLLLVGEPGIGKSRLAREAAAAAQRRGWRSCSDAPAPPVRPSRTSA